jgi:hypothetical protein
MHYSFLMRIPLFSFLFQVIQKITPNGCQPVTAPNIYFVTPGCYVSRRPALWPMCRILKNQPFRAAFYGPGKTNRGQQVYQMQVTDCLPRSVFF